MLPAGPGLADRPARRGLFAGVGAMASGAPDPLVDHRPVISVRVLITASTGRIMGWRRYLPGVVLGLLVGAGVLVAPPPPAAADVAGDSFTFTQPVGSRTSATVTVSFDRPVNPGAAAALGARIGAQIGARPSAGAGAAPASGTPSTVERMTCGQQITRSDGDGGANLRYACFPQYAVLNWYFRLSPALQATAVGGIDERGLS